MSTPNCANTVDVACETFRELRGALAELSAMIRSEGVAAVTWTLPDPMDSSSIEQDFREQAKLMGAAIDVSELTGAAAIEKAASVYSRVIRWAQQSPVHTIRTAGVVCIPNRAAVDLVKKINLLKSRFQIDLEEIHPRSHVRKKLIEGSDLKDVHQLQALRQIVVLDEFPARVGFTWEGHHRSVSSIEAGVLRQRIVDRYDHLGQWGEALKPFRDADMLAIVKKKSPTPAANVRLAEGFVKRPALMPFIVVGSVLPEITPLGNFRQPSRPPEGFRTGETQVDDRPLIPELHVHAYLKRHGACIH